MTQTQSRLSLVRRGRIKSGKRITLYGYEAIGKSTLGASAPAPVFIDIEDGTGDIDTDRYLFRDDDPRGHVPETLQEVHVAVDDLLKTDHHYKSLVIDTLDALEPLIWQYVCERDSGKQSNLNKSGKKLISIESYGYGRGYTVALDEWRRLAGRLDLLRVRKGMNIILLSHSQIRTFKNPEGDDYDRYQLRIKENAASFIKEWSDVVGYCCFENTTAKINEDDLRAKGYSTGRRLIMLERAAAYDAKSRVPMPSEVEMQLDDPWGPFAAALKAGMSTSPTQLLRLIHTELERINDTDLTEKVGSAIDNAKDNAAALSRYLNELRRRQPKEGVTNAN